jgi:class 3 adenylate cyclase
MQQSRPDDLTTERRLAAILMADVASYSRLMGEDEAGTLERLAAHRGIVEQTIARHGGRIANTAGDSLLAEFASAQNAARAALALHHPRRQRSGAERAAPVLPHRRACRRGPGPGG